MEDSIVYKWMQNNSLDKESIENRSKVLQLYCEKYHRYDNPKTFSYTWNLIWAIYGCSHEIKEETTIKAIHKYIEDVLTYSKEHNCDIEDDYLYMEGVKRFCKVDE